MKFLFTILSASWVLIIFQFVDDPIMTTFFFLTLMITYNFINNLEKD